MFRRLQGGLQADLFCLLCVVCKTMMRALKGACGGSIATPVDAKECLGHLLVGSVVWRRCLTVELTLLMDARF
jgi:hypothetical protein